MYGNRSSDGATSHASNKKHPENTVVSSVRSNDTAVSATSETLGEVFERPSEADNHTLRRVSGKVPWMAYSIAFVELCERFSYYGTAAVCE